MGGDQRLADGRDRIEHIAQLVHVGHGQRGHRCLVAYRVGKARAFTRAKAQAQAHGIGHGEDVREQDGRIQRIAVKRLKRHLGGVLRVGGQAHEAVAGGLA